MTAIFPAYLGSKVFFVCSVPLIELLFLLRLNRRKGLAVRALLGFTVYGVLSMGMPRLPGGLFLATFPVFLLSMLVMWTVFDATGWVVCFLCTQAYLVQIMAVNVYKLLIVGLGLGYNESALLHAGVIAAVAILAAWVMIFRLGQDQLVVEADYIKFLNTILSGWLIVIIDS